MDADSTGNTPTLLRPQTASRVLALVVAGGMVSALSACADATDSAAPTQNSVETQYIAILTNQGGLIADQQTMVRLGRDACQSLGFGIGSAESNRQMAVSQFVLSHDNISMKQAQAIITAASGSGLCKS